MGVGNEKIDKHLYRVQSPADYSDNCLNGVNFILEER